jgi:DNA mismatch repair protein MLH1
VVNRIAAGEILHRPANAVKELVENSLDAGATTVSVVCKHGGLKLLQVQDNGCGIKLEDFELLCERFATSKLAKYEDLQTIQTFGFRGEALASISHVAALKVSSMTADAMCGWRAQYENGRLVPQIAGQKAAPVACSGVRGTTITAENLFQNMPTRLNALKGPAEEYARVIEVVARYALHNSGVQFTCKKHGENSPDVHTARGATVIDNVKALFGHAIAREIVESECQAEPCGLVSCRAWFTHANCTPKDPQFVLFINNRLVDCTPLKKAVHASYAQNGMPKGSRPWVYISLKLRPQNVDVNVHPTKSEVRFLHEADVIEAVQKMITAKLAEHSKSRTFVVKGVAGASQAAVAAAHDVPPIDIPSESPLGSVGDPPSPLRVPRTSALPRPAGSQRSPVVVVTQNKMVRNDPTARTLDSYVQPIAPTTTDPPLAMDVEAGPVEPIVVAVPDHETYRSVQRSSPPPPRVAPAQFPSRPASNSATDFPMHDVGPVPDVSMLPPPPPITISPTSSGSATCQTTPARASPKVAGEETRGMKRSTPDPSAPLAVVPRRKPRKYKPCELTSVSTIVGAIEAKSHLGLEEALSNCTFVGFADAQFALIQHKTKLYIVNLLTLCQELFQQQVFMRFSNFDRLVLKPQLPLRDLLQTALDSPALSTHSTPVDIEFCLKQLMDVREMLAEYFAVEINNEGSLVALPQVVDSYVPDMTYLPLFVYHLATRVLWRFEKECFEGIARQIAAFYVPRPPSAGQAAVAAATAAGVVASPLDRYQWNLKHMLFPAVCSLENLYRVFERC